MTDKITLELTLDELKTLDKHIEYNEETKSVFDKIKYAYPQPQMTLQQEGDYVVVSYNDMTYYRLMGEDSCFCWYKRRGVSANHPVPTLVMITDRETERLLEGIYYNHIQVKKEKEQRTKKPVEECYKDWWGDYPELETDSQYDDTRWAGFQAGYEFAYQEKIMEKVQEEQKEDIMWKPVALRFGEKLSDVGPDGYYNFTPEEWFDWVVNTYGKGQQIKDAVRESVEWCEENPDKDPLDWLKPQTPEQVADGLKEAFREAVKQGVVSSSTKPKTLYQLIEDWWSDVFTTHSDWDMETSIANLVDEISLWLPTEHCTNNYKWNQCIRMIREKLR